MTFSADELEDGARAATGFDDFGSPYYREGLERTVEALNTEAELSEMGAVINTQRSAMPSSNASRWRKPMAATPKSTMRWWVAPSS